MLMEEGQALAIFEQYTKEDLNWTATKKKYLHNLTSSGETEEFRQGEKILKALLKYRDIIDFKMYRQSIEQIFPLDKYNVETRIEGGDPEKNASHAHFFIYWFEFVVMPRANAGSATPRCTIKIKAPGSRNLTSDVDASILSLLEGDPGKLVQEAAPRVKQGGADYAGRITNALIDGFYRFSEKEFGKTSAEHRDSNAYADLLSEEEKLDTYPKFKAEKNNPLIENERLFKEKDWDKFSKELSYCKLQKHRLEGAASLFSLCQALSNEEWQKFKDQVIQQITENVDILKGSPLEKIEKAALYTQVSSDDIKAIFQAAETLFTNYRQALGSKKKQLERNEEGYVSVLVGTAREKDLKVGALNRLYVENLECMVSVNGKIIDLHQENQLLIKGITLLATALKEEEQRLATYKNSAQLFKKQVVKSKAKCAIFRHSIESKVKQLQANFFKTLNLEIEKLRWRYRAHTFAHEAYVCRSAVYHVLRAQQGQHFEISEQTLLSSALQQIGFKLLHIQELSKQGESLGEVAYHTAKYSQRVHQLLLDQIVPNEQISLTFDKFSQNKINWFSHLKSEFARKNLFRIFSEKELLLLNNEVKIIADIKNNSQLCKLQKYAQIEAFLNQHSLLQNPQALFLSLASKLISAVYLSKFERIKEKVPTGLWGREKEINLTLIPTITPLFLSIREANSSFFEEVTLTPMPPSLALEKATVNEELQAEFSSIIINMKK